jgi:hypothetical protein
MLSKLLELLSQEFEVEVSPILDKQGGVTITVGLLPILCREISSTICFYGELGPLPQKNREECLEMVMNANFLGQKTGGATIGLIENEKVLTISSVFSSDVDYPIFKEQLEIFINHFEYWQKEISKYGS